MKQSTTLLRLRYPLITSAMVTALGISHPIQADTSRTIAVGNETQLRDAIRAAIKESRKFEIVEQLTGSSAFDDATVTTIDGIRVDYADGWGLVRASNTGPVLTLRFEADDNDALTRIQGIFRSELQAINEQLDF